MATFTTTIENEIYKVTSKSDGTECYAVPSDSNPGLFYKSCWNANTAAWTCTCKHGEIQAARGQAAHCKHVKAAQVAIVANKNREREEAEQERIRKEQERAAYLEFEFQCGSYNHPWA